MFLRPTTKPADASTNIHGDDQLTVNRFPHPFANHPARGPQADILPLFDYLLL